MHQPIMLPEELERSWELATQKHLKPSSMFGIAFVEFTPDADEAKHLSECRICRNWVKKYQATTRAKP
jgi:hypothetical protein